MYFSNDDPTTVSLEIKNIVTLYKYSDCYDMNTRHLL